MDESAPVNAEEGWTERMRRGTTVAPPTCDALNAVRPDDGSPRAGLERLQADLWRALGGVPTRPAALPDSPLGGAGGQDACVWQPGADGLWRIPLPAVGPGHASGGDELEGVVVLAVRQS